MDKQKQIEEMAKIMFEKAFENYKTSGSVEIDTEVRRHSYSAFLAYCEALYNANYRKIPENAVVLTGQDLELVCNIAGIISPSSGKPVAQAILDKERKETAEKFAESLKASGEIIALTAIGKGEIVEAVLKRIDEIAKEITEGKK